MNKKIKIENKKIESKCGWSPFDGFEFKGTPVATIIAGKVKMKDGEIIGELSNNFTIFHFNFSSNNCCHWSAFKFKTIKW